MNDETENFIRMTKLTFREGDINDLDLQNAWKFFKFKFYKQANILFEKLKVIDMAEM